MAITLVGTASNTSLNGADVTVTLPGGIAENDIVLVCGGHGYGSTATQNTSITTSGYTTLETASSSLHYNGVVGYKRMGASPDTEVTLAGAADTDQNTGQAAVVMVFRGVSTSTAIDATTIEATSATGDPNSGSITTVTNGAAVISCFVMGVSTGAAYTAPTNYNDAVEAVSSEFYDVRAGAAWDIKDTAGAENPAAWTGTDFEAWAAWTVALRPATSSFGDGAFSGGSISGTASLVGVDANAGSSIFSATGTGTASLASDTIFNAPVSMTGTGTASFEGASIAAFGVLSATGTGTASFIGGLLGGGDASMTGTGTASFVADLIFSGALSVSATGTAIFTLEVGRLKNVIMTIETAKASTTVH